MDKQPLLSHFGELLTRFKRCFLWVIIGSALGYHFADFFLAELNAPIIEYLGANNLVFTRFFEKVGVMFRVALIAGILFASPLLGWEILSFIKPALKPKERRHLGTFIALTVIFFIAGSFVGYRYILPFIIKTILSFGHSDLVPMLTISSYINAAIGVVLMSALFFEIPVLMVNLSLWGWVSSSTWRKGRRMSIVINAVISAFLSPPDPWSMLLMMLPLQVLFEFGILLAYLTEKFSKNDDPEVEVVSEDLSSES